MATIPYPVFDGTNPKSWLAQMEGAMLANGIAADNHARRLGIASYHMGPFQSWLANHNPAIVQWDNTRAGHHGFKQHFLAEFFNNETKEEALTIAERRIQKPGESIDMYIAALRRIWQECDPNEMTDYHKLKNFLSGLTPAIRMSVKQTMPADLNAAITTAKAHYRAVKEEMQPEPSMAATEVNEALTAEIKELREKLKQLEMKEPAQQNQWRRPEHVRQSVVNMHCFYCGKMGHRQFDCRIKELHIKQGRKLRWYQPPPRNDRL
ncbi:2266_t:CDS:1 [Paraglomus occultum]|uniref:2266_t:CDS:1 n=1 Tax=Paraglomus occultum TaxID=144539 RepID=A0A9N9CD27_9GLOM|nr:2266_t:CDS:1 [Paraglomus occultum]